MPCSKSASRGPSASPSCSPTAPSPRKRRWSNPSVPSRKTGSPSMSSEVNASGGVRATGTGAGATGSSAVTGRDIAVIGMAARLPEADDLQQFLRNLRDGRDSVRELTDDRITRTSLHPEEQYQLS